MRGSMRMPYTGYPAGYPYPHLPIILMPILKVQVTGYSLFFSPTHMDTVSWAIPSHARSGTATEIDDKSFRCITFMKDTG